MRKEKFLLPVGLLLPVWSLLSCSGSDISGNMGGETMKPDSVTPYITRVLDYLPAPGQFVNTLPSYENGDTQEDMNRKVFEAIGANRRGLVTLGGYGGYVVVGFDHTIENKVGLCDFRVLGNAFYATSNPASGRPEGGSCEPGIIRVAYDRNGNGLPDTDEWYEIAGSAHRNSQGETWYALAQAQGNVMNLYSDYVITYYRPTSEPADTEAMSRYLRWTDNQGQAGYRSMNAFHRQSYFPQWVQQDSLVFQGTCLPQNAVDEVGDGSYFVLYKFAYGYADNDSNSSDGSAIDIDWAVDSQGHAACLPGVDFIMIYTGVNQESGRLGECSTEVSGVEDLHLLGVKIQSNDR